MVGLQFVYKIFVNVCFVGYVNLAHFFLIWMLNAGIQNPILKLLGLILILFINYLKFLKQNPLKFNICISFYQIIFIICLWVILYLLQGLCYVLLSEMMSMEASYRISCFPTIGNKQNFKRSLCPVLGFLPAGYLVFHYRIYVE